MKTLKSILIFILSGVAAAMLCACPGTSKELDSGGLPSDPSEEEGTMREKIYITIGENKVALVLEKNAAVETLIELLTSGDIVYTADDYGGFEKVGSLGHSLPRSDRQMTTQPGDVVLYSGNQIVMFYGNNSWAYTKLGKIECSPGELKTLLAAGKGRITVTLSLN